MSDLAGEARAPLAHLHNKPVAPSDPILRFHSVPDSVDVHIIDRSGLPFLGAGETGQGPAAAAIANAIADATGQRLRDLPLTAAKLRAAVGVHPEYGLD